MGDNQYINFGSKKIEFQVSYSQRKTLGITITPDMNVLVKAPVGTSIEKINEKVKKKAPWIIKQQSYFLTYYPKTPARKYISGETHLYMGRQYQLKVTPGKRNEIKYKGRFIEVITRDKRKAKDLLNQWYRLRAKIRFSEIAGPVIQRFNKYNIEPENLYIQEMPTRWGSCTPKGKIILNPELIKAPKGCIEYVIIHELCHLIYPCHSKRFIDLLTKEMPDWEKWKIKLETLLA